MKKHYNALTGIGFTREEADELLKNRKRHDQTPEERRAHLAALKRALARQKKEALAAAEVSER